MWALSAHAHCDGVNGGQSQSIAAAHTDVRSALLCLERYDEALRHFCRAMSIDEVILGESHPTLARRWTNPGVGHYKTGNLTNAIGLLGESYRIRHECFGANHPITVDTAVALRQLKADAKANGCAGVFVGAGAVRLAS